MNKTIPPFLPMFSMLKLKLNKHIHFHLLVLIQTFSFLLFFSFLLQINIHAQCHDFTCKTGYELRMNQDCIGFTGGSYLLEAPHLCVAGPKIVEYYTATGNSIGDTVTSEYLNQTLQFQITNVWTGHSCQGTVVVVDKLGPKIECEDITIPCYIPHDNESLSQPNIEENCSYVNSVSSQDSIVTNFGCGTDGFQNYFTPENWNTIYLNTDGDGGVDVAGAPWQISVTGAFNSPINNNCPYVTRYLIEVPAEGHFSFDWSSQGGSSLLHDNAYFTIGDTCVLLTDSVTYGQYTSWSIEAGTWVSFEVVSNGDNDPMTLIVDNFNFHTNTLRVIDRKWIATDGYGNESSCIQKINLTRLDLSNIYFPKNYDDVELEVINYQEIATDPTITNPVNTGFPYYDEDNLLSTTSDQYELIGGVNVCQIEVSYNDQTYFECDYNFSIFRYWTIYYACSGETITHTQIIRVQNTLFPTINCPGDLNLAVNAELCLAALTPPSNQELGVEENITISYHWVDSPFITSFNELPIGQYNLQITAANDCGLSSSCIVTVTVFDDTQPIAICDQHTVVSINNEGQSFIFAQGIDNGSYDNCCPANSLDFLVKLTNSPESEYTSVLILDCNNVAETQAIDIKISDCYGNSNFCEVFLDIQDNQIPELVCPNNVYLSCDDNTTDLSQFGYPTFSDNCTTFISETVDYQVNGCGQGYIYRHFSLTDMGGNVVQCTQTLIIEGNSNFSEDAIVFPDDYYMYDPCNIIIDPALLPSDYSYPSLVGNFGCSEIEISFSDEWYTTEDDTCNYISRTWTVVNQCIDESQSFTHIQTLFIIDQEAPNISIIDPVITLILESENDCSVVFNILPPEVEDCSNIETINLSGALGNYFGQSIITQAGEYTLQYTAIDVCGNSTHAFQTIVVLDNGSPSFQETPENVTLYADQNNNCLALYNAVMPEVTSCGTTLDVILSGDLNQGYTQYLLATGSYEISHIATSPNGDIGTQTQYINVESQSSPVAQCIGQLEIDLNEDHIYIIQANQINNGSFIPCGNNSELNYSFDIEGEEPSMVLGCNDVGYKNVTLFVTDLYGQQSQCTSTLIINPYDITYCEDQPNPIAISGTIITQQNEAIELVDIELEYEGSLSTEISQEDGMYNFENNVSGGSGIIIPYKNIYHSNGISALDLYKINDHITDDLPFGNAFQHISADANNDQEISQEDIDELEDLILSNIFELSNNTSWRFILSDYNFIPNQNPLTQNYPEFYTIESQGTDLNVDFYGIKIGDVNNTANPHTIIDNTENESRNTETQWIRVDNQTFSVGDTIEVRLQIEDITDIGALQFAIEINNNLLELIDIWRDELLDINYNSIFLNDKTVVKQLWVDYESNDPIGGQSLIVLKMVAQDDGKLSDAIGIMDEEMESSAYKILDNGYIENQNIRLKFIELVSSTINVINNKIEIFPNPSSGICRLSIPTNVEDQFNLYIFDQNGVQLDESSYSSSRGIDYIGLDFNIKMFEHRPILFVKIVGDNTIFIGKIILLN